MALELRQLLDKVSELDITLIAGQDGLHRKVRWVHMVETEETSMFLEGEDIAITTGIGLNQRLALINLVKMLIDFHASGMVLNLGPFIKEVPAEVIDYCNDHAFPLFTVPWKVHLAQIMRTFAHAITMADQSDLEISIAFRNAIFFPQQTDQYEIPLTEKGIKPDSTFYACAVFWDKAKNNYSVLENFTLHLSIHMDQQNYKNFSLFPYDDIVLIVFWNYEKTQLNAVIKELAQFLKKEIALEDTWLIGVGKQANHISCLYKSYNQATEIQNLQYRHIIPKDHYHFEDLGVYYLLMSVDNREVYEQYYQQTLAPILENDQIKDKHLSDILKYYLEHNGSVRQTADHFFMHRNSINYRLNQIQELLDMDLSELDTRIQLRLAFMVRDMLD